MKIQIPNTCEVHWETMKIGHITRYCDNCNKDVIDFTKMTRNEILEYLTKNSGKQICGHIQKSKLDYSHTELLIEINAQLEASHLNNRFLILSLASLLLLSCTTEPVTTSKLEEILNDSVPIISSSIQLGDTLKVTCTLKNEDTVKTKKNHKNDSAPIVLDEMINGEMIAQPAPTDEEKEKSIYLYGEVMPEFIGGDVALFNYLRENLIYPKWEKMNKIEGMVVVTFVVDKSGSLRDFKILKSVKGSKNFDNEVLRMLKKMPNWKSGTVDNQAVSIQYNLPIRFKL